jgi:hypothetical protein
MGRIEHTQLSPFKTIKVFTLYQVGVLLTAVILEVDRES